MKNIIFSFILITVIVYTDKASAQFKGGNGCGYVSAVSVTQQLNQPLYNDLEITAITHPLNNETLLINTPYNLVFTIENMGTFPVFPDDSLYFNITYGLNVLIDSFLFLTDTLHINQSLNITLANILSFTDSSEMADLCTTINGTSFAADSVTNNNTFCVSIKIKDPTAINENTINDIAIYFNDDTHCIIIENNKNLEDVKLFDMLGREMAFKRINNISETRIYPLCNKQQLVLITFNTSGSVYTKKLLIHKK